MSKRKNAPTRADSRAKRKRTAKQQQFPVIPVAVVVVVLAIVAGAAISLSSPQSAANTGASDGGLVTPGPLPTLPIPFPTVPRISLQDALAKLDQGQAVLIDVRSRGSYDTTHAAGALSFPEEEIDARLDELPRDRDLVLYCT
jgi:hypothetical protein